jgi:hypothetical protein
MQTHGGKGHFRDGPVLTKARELYQHYSFVNITVTPVGPCPLDAADIVTFSYSVAKIEAKPICDAICRSSLPRRVNGNSLSRKSSMPLGLLTRGCPSSDTRKVNSAYVTARGVINSHLTGWDRKHFSHERRTIRCAQIGCKSASIKGERRESESDVGCKNTRK